MSTMAAARMSTLGAASRSRPDTANRDRVESTREQPARTANSAEARPAKIAAQVGIPASSPSAKMCVTIIARSAIPRATSSPMSRPSGLSRRSTFAEVAVEFASCARWGSAG